MDKGPYAAFPHIVTDGIIIRKMVAADLDALYEICSNAAVYRYAPAFLHTDSRKTLETAIVNLGGRDFDRRKYIIAGICLPDSPDRVVGTAEMFDYDPETAMITIGYKVNEAMWGRGIATKAVAAMADYLFRDAGINRIQAFVMPENAASERVLLKNGFAREGVIRQGHFWKGKGVVDLALFARLRGAWEA